MAQSNNGIERGFHSQRGASSFFSGGSRFKGANRSAVHQMERALVMAINSSKRVEPRKVVEVKEPRKH